MTKVYCVLVVYCLIGASSYISIYIYTNICRPVYNIRKNTSLVCTYEIILFFFFSRTLPLFVFIRTCGVTRIFLCELLKSFPFLLYSS